MVEIVERYVKRHFEITAENGDYFEINPGESYTTSLERADGTVKVYSRYWVPVPMDYFELLKPDIAPKIDTTIAIPPTEESEESRKQ